MSKQFPVGGSKDKVYGFMRQHGFVMSDWSDKHWKRADGVEAHIYGVGSKARIVKDGKVLHDDELDNAVVAARF